MMSKLISLKKVLDVLLDEYNENSDAYHYYKATSDTVSAAVCMASMNTVCEILASLGFDDVADCKTESKELFRNGLHFTTIRKELLPWVCY